MTKEFRDLKAAINRVFPTSRLEPLPEADLTAIRNQHPGIPEHYLSFLRHIGWGSMGNGHFMIYSGPLEPHDIFDEETAAGLPGLLLIGDNFSGWLVGFDKRKSWSLIGVESSSVDPHPEEATTVGELISRLVAAHEAT